MQPFESGDDLFKKTKNWSRKKKAAVAVVTIVLFALIVTVIYANFKPEDLPEYQVQTVEKGDIQSTFDTQGVVESGSTETFTAASGVRVMSVDVKVGDHVTAGQQLATFDVSTLNTQLAAYKSAYDKAKSSYDKSAKSVSDAKTNLSSVKSEIAAVEKEVAQLQKEVDAAENAQVSLPETPKLTEAQIQQIMQQLASGGMTQEQISEIIAELRAQTGNVDITEALQNSAAARKLQLTQKQAQLTALETQRTLYETQQDTTITDLYKSVMDQKSKEYESYKALVDSLKTGWKATADGIVTEVNLTAGEVFTPKTETNNNLDLSSIMSMASGNSDVASVLSDIFSTTAGSNTGTGTGIIVENYGDFYASFTVGKYDFQDLKVGQKATVISLDKTYDAVVTYVSATANSTSGFDISSITSSLTGGSSSTSTNSAPVQVKIINPDEKIVLGFDVDVKIDTEKLENVVRIPVEAVTSSEGENCVFVYDPEEKTVVKRTVELGIGSDTYYEVTSGVSLGEQVVLNPKTALQDGDKIAVKS